MAKKPCAPRVQFVSRGKTHRYDMADQFGDVDWKLIEFDILNSIDTQLKHGNVSFMFRDVCEGCGVNLPIYPLTINKAKLEAHIRDEKGLTGQKATDYLAAYIRKRALQALLRIQANFYPRLIIVRVRKLVMNYRMASYAHLN